MQGGHRVMNGNDSVDLGSAGLTRGVVAAPHRAAVEAGRAMLAEGGNAIEAMIAMAAAIAAVYPHMNHVGGDGFFILREPSGRVRAAPAQKRPSPSIASMNATRSRRAGRSLR
jgi:gamma-glutamyltranspeptidase